MFYPVERVEEARVLGGRFRELTAGTEPRIAISGDLDLMAPTREGLADRLDGTRLVLDE